MITKKSQAALEFIMTYGWAILVVLVAIGALAYFGVLSPDRFLPSKCTLQSGIACLDHKATKTVTGDQLTIVYQNSLGQDITIDRIQADQCLPLGTGVKKSASVRNLPNGGQGSDTLGVAPVTCTFTSTTKYNGDVNITYTIIETDVQHKNQGHVTTKLE